MQSQVHSQSNTGVTAASELDTEPQPAECQSGAQEEEKTSAAPVETEAVADDREEEEETPASMAVTAPEETNPTAQSQTESSENTEVMEANTAQKPNSSTKLVPDTNTKLCSAGLKTKKLGKSDGRKCVPSRKALVDPLKIDMSKPGIIPLTSSQLSLQCMECHIIFRDGKSKERHLKLNHPAEYEQCILRNALFACYVCDRHFTNSTELMIHQKGHTEKKPFKCPVCDLAFKKSSELTSHKKVHFGQDGYPCTDCGKMCKTLTLLKYHQRTHTGEKPYVCKDCGKRFTTSRALQKHMIGHLSEGAEGDVGDTTGKGGPRKNDSVSTTKYPCSVCKAIFKSSRTRLRHIRSKHVLPAAVSNAHSAGQQEKLCTPIITPISIGQPGLLQVEPNGPLQRVDANIDTEQICRLIESMGNVQKVNQVVILGQVPPDAPPLEVQQISQLVEPVNLNVPPQIDFTALKQADSNIVVLDPSNIPCDSMEQTIILEPITPDGQLENPPFSELSSHIAAEESIELTLVPAEHIQRPEGEEMQQILQQSEMNAVHSNPIDQIICQNEADEQTVILELTPALIPTAELEQSQTVPQNEIPSTVLVMNTEPETPGQTIDQTVADEQEPTLSVPSFMTTVELELTHIQPEQQDISSCSLVLPDALAQTPGESETNPTGDAAPEQEVSIDQVPSVMEGEAKETQEKADTLKPTETSHGDSNKVTEAEDQSAQKEDTPQTKQVPQMSEIPVNVMSAQELVKVRKRKPARAFFFQGYMQDLVGSIYRDDFQIDAKPTKRQRKNKSHLVVKFGPQSKEKKNKKQKKSPQQRQSMQEDVIRAETNLSEKKSPPQKKGRKGKKDKVVGNMLSEADKQSSSSQVSLVEQVTVDKSKNKGKKQKEATKGISEHKAVTSPMFKKKKQARMLQKDQSKKVKAAQAKKNMEKDEQVKEADVSSPHVTQDSLLLLKGHKQPQLKVYKLDPSKASAKALDASPNESQTSPDQSNNEKFKNQQSEPTESPKADGKKKGGRRPKKNQKALSLLSSIQISRQPKETPPIKPKTNRKRKASSNVETEGVITSKRALKCKDCGENFSEVSSLQMHKATVHIVESPSLTYTNGNIFEGVSRLDLFQLPQGHNKVVGEMNAASDWDTEPEMTLEDRERNVSFPALIPSPSLPNPATDVDISPCEVKGVNKTGSNNQSHTSPEIHSLSDEIKNGETLTNFTSESFLSTSTQTKTFEVRESLTSEKHKQEEDTPKIPSSESEVKCDEDIKEDLLLEVDLVTVGEQNERDGPVSHEEMVTQTESNGNADKHHEQADNEPSDKGLTSQTVSCSTHQVEIKEEEEEMLVQKKKDEGKTAVIRNAARGRRRATGHQKKDARQRRGTESEKEQDECQVVYEVHPVTSDSEVVNNESGTKTLEPQTSPNKTIDPVTTPSPPTIEESSEGQVVLELAAVTTSVEEVMNERGQQGEEAEDRNQSPAIILEKFLTSRHIGVADKEPCQITARDNQRQGLHSIAQNEIQVLNSQEIKDEENCSDPQHVVPTCENTQSTSMQPQSQRDIRTVLVKEESSHGSKHIRWNVEPISSENTVISLMESEDTTTECQVIPEFNTSQCIFYPVKEEEREVLLGAAQTTRGSGSEGSSTANTTELQSRECNMYEGSPSTPEDHQTLVRGLLSEPGLSDFSVGQDSRWQSPSDLRKFLLQSSDEEDTGGFELSDPQLDLEADVMAYFYRNQTNSANLPTLQRHSYGSREETGTRKPIDYFSKYFGWDTWVDIASCTNKLSKLQNLVTSKEVACFVGIHIAMGTLKFPSPKLYWEDLTRVPLIADAMPLPRFLELSHLLKLTSPTKDPASCNSQERTCDSPTMRQADIRNDLNSSQTDPLWKVHPILCRFKAACQSLRRECDYAVDQYPLPLTGKKHSGQPSLHCTTLIGFGGLVVHVDLKLDLSDKESAVEKMVPKGSMVFLCKQELSTPAMLERLLVAGVHGAGRVGGARGQIGDEFVSSDGKLMLRRSHCGFILSTAGNCQSNMASLTENFEKAQMSARLNRDLQNLYSIPLIASVPTCWPQAVLWYLTDLALVNSWLLYRQGHTAPLTLMAFRLEVSKALILSSSSDTQDSVPPQPPTEKTHRTNGTPNPVLVEESPLPDAATRYDGSGHWPEQLGEGEGGRCRFGDCQRTSRVLCLKCCVFLCISRNHNCFLNFHNQGSSGKE